MVVGLGVMSHNLHQAFDEIFRSHRGVKPQSIHVPIPGRTLLRWGTAVAVVATAIVIKSDLSRIRRPPIPRY